jgi:hypothetical protein
MRQLPIEDLLESPPPGEEFPGLPAPKFLWGVDRFGVEPLIGGFAPKIGLGFELGRRPEYPVLPGN